MVFMRFDRPSGDANDADKDFRPDVLYSSYLIDDIKSELRDVRVSSGTNKSLQYTTENIATQVHKQSGRSIYLRGMHLEYKFELVNQELNDVYGTGVCLRAMLVHNKYDMYREGVAKLITQKHVHGQDMSASSREILQGRGSVVYSPSVRLIHLIVI